MRKRNASTHCRCKRGDIYCKEVSTWIRSICYFSFQFLTNNCLNYLTHLWDVLEQLRGVEVQHSCWKAQWPKYKGWKNRWHIWRPWQRPIWCRKGQAHSHWLLYRRFPAHCHCPIRLGNIVCQQLSIALQRKKGQIGKERLQRPLNAFIILPCKAWMVAHIS